MDKIMALVPTSNNQIIAVPIKTLTTNSKIQLTTSSVPQTSTISTNQTIKLPTTAIKSIAELKTLPSSLKIANNVLSIKKTDHSAESSNELKPATTYLICSKNNLLTDLNKVDDLSTKNQLGQSNQAVDKPTITINKPIAQLFHQPINQIIISQPSSLTSTPVIITSQPLHKPIQLASQIQPAQHQTQSILQQTSQPVQQTQIIDSRTKQTTLESNQPIEMEVMNASKFTNQLESIREEECGSKDEMEVSNRSTNEIDEMIDDLEMLSSPESDFEPADVLVWNQNVGVLPGTNLQFKMNEYKLLELLTDKEADEIRSHYSEQYYYDSYLPNGIRSDDLYSVCLTCSMKGLTNSFIRKGRFCSQDCATFHSTHLRSSKNTSQLDKLTTLGKQQKLQRNRKSTFDFERDNYMNGYEIDDVRTKVKENFNQEKYFSWKKYLIETRSIAAPLKCFRPNQIYSERANYFKQGMKLEAVDPLHPSLFCVATIAEVVGFRVRIHLDKYSSIFDFWANCDSPFIFNVGFCSQTNRQLQPPKNYDQFDWPTYLQQEKAKAAPKHCFYWHNKLYSSPPGFKVGMKLEAVDKANSSLVCVASIVDILGDWLLIHFDGWDSTHTKNGGDEVDYDYWTEYTSSYIRPINWCKSKGKSLTAPKDYVKSNFNWQEYLEETRSTCVPASAFQVRSVNTFKPFMKLEVVDRRNPRYIRVATIIARGSYSIKINFDNWDEKYDFWIDDDSPDIHPVNWCYHTDSYIEEPPPYDYDPLSYYNRCCIFGCKSFGHIRNPNLLFHETIEDCPYSEENMDYEPPDRFGDSSELSSENYYMNEDESNPISNAASPNSESNSLSTLNDKYSKLAKTGLYNSYTLECFDMYNSDSERLSHCSSPNSDMNLLPIRQSIIDIKTSFLQMEEPLLHWDKNTKHLVSYVNTLRAEEVLKWSCDQVGDFVSRIPGCEEYASKFKDESIDGESLLLLTQNDLIKILGIKLGPGIKLYNSILILRRNISP